MLLTRLDNDKMDLANSCHTDPSGSQQNDLELLLIIVFVGSRVGNFHRLQGADILNILLVTSSFFFIGLPCNFPLCSPLFLVADPIRYT